MGKRVFFSPRLREHCRLCNNRDLFSLPPFILDHLIIWTRFYTDFRLEKIETEKQKTLVQTAIFLNATIVKRVMIIASDGGELRLILDANARRRTAQVAMVMPSCHFIAFRR